MPNTKITVLFIDREAAAESFSWISCIYTPMAAAACEF